MELLKFACIINSAFSPSLPIKFRQGNFQLLFFFNNSLELLLRRRCGKRFGQLIWAPHLINRFVVGDTGGVKNQATAARRLASLGKSFVIH